MGSNPIPSATFLDQIPEDTERIRRHPLRVSHRVYHPAEDWDVFRWMGPAGRVLFLAQAALASRLG